MTKKRVFKFSPSQIKTWRACRVKWALDKIDGVPRESTPKQRFGQQVHKHIEDWLKQEKTIDRTDPAGRVAAQAVKKGLLPRPNPDLGIEDYFKLWLPDTPEGTCAHGYIDVEAPMMVTGEPSNLLIDHKTTTPPGRYALSKDELFADPQAVLYAWAMMQRWEINHVRARWIYYLATAPKNGPREPAGCFPVEVDFHRDDSKFMDHLRAIKRDMAAMREDLLQYDRAVDMPGPDTPAPCAAYGGCDYEKKGLCSKRPTVTLESLFTDKGDPAMGLLDSVADTPASVPDDASETEAPASVPDDAPKPGDLLSTLRAQGDAKGINPPDAPPVTPPAESKVSLPDTTPVKGSKRKPQTKAKTQKHVPPMLPDSGDTIESKTKGVSEGGDRFVLMLNCRFVKRGVQEGHVVLLSEWAEPFAQAVAASLDVPYYSLADFGKGDAHLAARVDTHLRKEPFKGTLCVDSFSKFGTALLDVLVRHADVVIQAIR